MTKEKIFTPEDFDKPNNKNFWQKYKRWILCFAALLSVAIIVLCCIFCFKVGQMEEIIEKTQTEHVSEKLESNTTSMQTKDRETETIQDAQEVSEVSNVESETLPTTVKDAEEPKIQLENNTPKREAQTTNVSSNVEQEALNVIRGNYGNVPERREKLGTKYQTIQNRVNELKREGAF